MWAKPPSVQTNVIAVTWPHNGWLQASRCTCGEDEPFTGASASKVQRWCNATYDLCRNAFCILIRLILMIIVVSNQIYRSFWISLLISRASLQTVRPFDWRVFVVLWRARYRVGLRLLPLESLLMFTVPMFLSTYCFLSYTRTAMGII